MERNALFISRFLAFFVDYLVIVALSYIFSIPFTGTDFVFIGTLIAGLMYFGAGNSEITGGQTLGKKAFGLRVVSAKDSKPLSLHLSLLRYCVFFGLIIVVAETPPLVYRTIGLSYSPIVLEAHMAFVMFWFFASIFYVFVSGGSHGLHDKLVKSRIERLEPTVESLSTYKSASISIAIGLGALVSVFLWWAGVNAGPEVSRVHKERYRIENHIPARILSIQNQAGTVVVDIVALTNTNQDLPLVVEKFKDFLPTTDILEASSQFRFQFHQDRNAREHPIVVSFDGYEVTSEKK